MTIAYTKDLETGFSIMSATDKGVMQEVEVAKSANITQIHVDYLDGRFTLNSKPFDCTRHISIITGRGVPLEVHLMAIEPSFSIVEKMLNNGLKPNRDSVLIHYESFSRKSSLNKFVDLLGYNKLKIGLVLNPETDVNIIREMYDVIWKIDSIVLMGVTPGGTGRKFHEGTVKRIKLLQKVLCDLNLDNITIGVDGGINRTNFRCVLNTGVNHIIARTWLLKRKGISDVIARINNLSSKLKHEEKAIIDILNKHNSNLPLNIVDAIYDFCAGSDFVRQDDVEKYLSRVENVRNVRIGVNMVDIIYDDKIIKFNSKDKERTEYHGIIDRINYKDCVIKVYENKELNNGKYILGISGTWHDSTAALVKDGKLIAALEEERLSRVKHDSSPFPLRAIKKLLESEKITLDDISHVAIGWNYNRYVHTENSKSPDSLFFEKMDSKFAKKKSIPASKVVRRNLPEKNKKRFSVDMVNDFLSTLKNDYNVSDVPKVIFVKHHLAHAASAYYPSGFNETTLTVVLDGYGDNEAASVWIGNSQKLKQVASMKLPNSIGWVYVAMTEFLGFRPNSGEGQVMGFSPYGEPNGPIEEERVNKLQEVFDDYLYFKDGQIVVNPENLYYGEMVDGTKRITKSFAKKLADLGIAPYQGSDQEVDPFSKKDRPYANLAYVLQRTTDDVVAKLVEYYLAKFPEAKKVAIAGGVALNILSNGELISRKIIDSRNLYIQPAASDAGTAIGSALIVAEERGAVIDSEMDHAFFGPTYEEKEIEKALVRDDISYEKVTGTEMIEAAAQSIKNKHAIAWFQGRSEVGPRALGARSILLNVFDNAASNSANTIKDRQPWRPSALSIIEEEAKDIFVGIDKSPFMVVAFSVNPEKKDMFASGVHQHGKRLARPQTISKEAHPKYWGLLKRVGELIGVSAVVNTSFNKQEPLVETPTNAINTFLRMEGVSKLFLENYIVSKG
jgi:carbamoyltransferase